MIRLAALLLLWTAPVLAMTSADKPAVFRQVGYDQNVGGQLPLDAPFRDAEGRHVTLGAFFDRRPVLLVFSYFHCSNLCPAVLAGVTAAMNAMPLATGEDFDLVVISIDPHDTPAMAAAARRDYARRYRGDNGVRGWHFLTGRKEAVDAVAAAAGFRYVWVPEREQYAHAAGIVVATPGGRLSRYFLGVKYPASSVRLALVEASEGAVGDVVDQLLLYCFQYDPQTGKYGVVIMNVLRLMGGATVLVLGATVVGLQWRSRRRHTTGGRR